MHKIFKYSLLKYRPSYVLGEQVNIGILFIFLDDNRVSFFFPNNLKRRLSALYPEVNVPNLKLYLSAFEAKARKLSANNLFGEANADNLIEKEFFLADANSLFFDTFKTGIYESPSRVEAHFTKQFFADYDGVPDNLRKDNKYLIRKFIERVKPTNKFALFEQDVLLSNKLVQATFDIRWQNGTTNYTKSLSFDLLESEYIQRKALQWYGEITQLNIDNDFSDKRFDFLVAEPSNKDLFQYFDKALAILHNIPQHKRIVRERDLNHYIAEAIETIKPPFVELNQH
jgi:Protein of unknown function (DUF3037)